jgi:hypothetical protein
MALVSSFEAELQSFRPVLSRRSFANLVTILTGWVLTKQRTITRMMVAAEVAGTRHHSIFHRLFSQARWSLDRLGLILLGRVVRYLPPGAVLLSLDDTLAHKRGRKMYGVGMHHDPLLSGQGKVVTTWGHNWVVLAVIIRFARWPKRVFSFPILCRLYLNKKSAAKWKVPYRTHGELALEMIHILCKHDKSRRFHVIADSAYGGQNLLQQLPDNCDLTTGLHLDARLYEARPPRRPGQMGRPRHRGQRLPNPKQMLAGQRKHLKMNLYGRRQDIEVADTVAYLYDTPDRPLRIVAVEPLQKGCRQRAFYSTCIEATAEEVLTWYAQRWSLEVTFHDVKQYLGFEDLPGRTRRAVERTAPIALLLYGLIVQWYVEYAADRDTLPLLPWYRSKQEPSFCDMLLALRRESLDETLFSNGTEPLHPSKVKKTLTHLLQIAA